MRGTPPLHLLSTLENAQQRKKKEYVLPQLLTKPNTICCTFRTYPKMYTNQYLQTYLEPTKLNNTNRDIYATIWSFQRILKYITIDKCFSLS